MLKIVSFDTLYSDSRIWPSAKYSVGAAYKFERIRATSSATTNSGLTIRSIPRFLGLITRLVVVEAGAIGVVEVVLVVAVGAII